MLYPSKQGFQKERKFIRKGIERKGGGRLFLLGSECTCLPLNSLTLIEPQNPSAFAFPVSLFLIFNSIWQSGHPASKERRTQHSPSVWTWELRPSPLRLWPTGKKIYWILSWAFVTGQEKQTHRQEKETLLHKGHTGIWSHKIREINETEKALHSDAT